MQKIIKINNLKISNNLPLAFMAGTCVIEGEQHFLDFAKKLKALIAKTKHPFILKASFDKANRTSVDAYRGPGLSKGLEILAKAKKLTGLPVLTDVHEPWQAEEAAQVADILQIPAFLCRQTDLVLACADTGKAVNVKKGQFLAPGAMEQIIKKIESRGNKNILLTERGASFGYGDLVVDMRSLEIMKQFGYPVIFDATHSVQNPEPWAPARAETAKWPRFWPKRPRRWASRAYFLKRTRTRTTPCPTGLTRSTCRLPAK